MKGIMHYKRNCLSGKLKIDPKLPTAVHILDTDFKNVELICNTCFFFYFILFSPNYSCSQQVQ